ncbi:hypothetical protein H4R33_005949 [Dimargaris cristalligena]|uniref:ER membrane protein complex subunit 3 n=1 Tax=Dimargaris cristalligena TaxID=215637 RepID=A0A4P9ZSD3_9FUNG|nr:hypothetical protein H4R33_005949 [Dimargaris cristalligena]RKP36383.1 integral membrane protein DUF106-domain-containing protein [Dimargaris cristalligena]|eukprot:RKP36383.1 integral membrane protein DUF106-domain-containing protein [Dimargaris cristalligena]
MAESGQQMFLDPAIRDWVLIPITIVMVLVGVLRHQMTVLMNGKPKPPTLAAVKESKALMRGSMLVRHHDFIPYSAFLMRKEFLSKAFESGRFLKNPGEMEANGAPNPLSDPAGMEMMMDGMKKNMMSIIPQTVIMGWINFFFSGFVLIKLPFPLTVRFKSMLQAGVLTPDMDVAWVSSLSWYFLNLFGLRGIFSLILGAENTADGMRDMQAMGTMGMSGQPGQPQNFHKLFLAEKENLDIANHRWALEGIEERLLLKYGKQSPPTVTRAAVPASSATPKKTTSKTGRKKKSH